MRRSRIRNAAGLGLAVVMLSVVLASCTPPPAPVAVPWKFDTTSLTVNSSQDAVYDPIFHACISFSGCSDEPYVMNVNFTVQIGVANSATTDVTGGHSCGHSSISAGNTVTDAGCWRGTKTFSVAPLTVTDLLTGNGHLTVFGSYNWIMEEDTVGVGEAASGTATILKDALNQTLAAGSIPSDLSTLLSLITSNLGSAFGILAGNIPLFGLGDDVIGGALHVGIGASGDLGTLLDGQIGAASFPSIAIPLVDLPPDINGGGFYTMSAAKAFNGEHFHGGCSLGTCGDYTINFGAGPG